MMNIPKPLRAGTPAVPAKTLLFVMLCCAMGMNAMAQTPSLQAGSASGLPGTSVAIPVTFTAGSTDVSSLQFELTVDPSLASRISYSSVTTGQAATLAEKGASAAAISNGARVLVYGVNATAIGSGEVATVRFNISSSALPGNIPLAVTNIVASAPNEQSVPTTGLAGAIQVLVPVDTTAPVISGVTSSGITTSSATISWTTNEPADTQVEYGTSTAYGSTTTLNSTLATSHSQSLSGLTAGTLYHYRVKSKDLAANPSVSGDYTFTTSTPDTTGPVISGVTSSGITTSSATISWTTNEPADTQVEYGTSTAYGSSTTLNSTLATSHSQSLSGLTAGTAYHYRVKSKDAAGNPSASGDYTFTTAATPDTTAPVISGVSSSGVTGGSAFISWSTDEPADSQVEYGTTASYGSSAPLNGAYVTSHGQTLSGLAGSTTYHYRVRSKDASGNEAVSGDNTFNTTEQSDSTPPIILMVKASNILGTTATISWTTNEAADSEVEYGTTADYGRASGPDPDLATTHARELADLTPDTLYHYRVKSKDAAGNAAVSGDYTFTTSASDNSAPVVSNVSSSSITKNQALISWDTSEPADTQVEYGLTVIYDSSTALNAGMATSHSRLLTGLSPDTTYHYHAKSRDEAGNLGLSQDYTFTTAPEGTAPVISAVTISDITYNSATISWTTDKPADSVVEYWPWPFVGTPLKSALAEPATQHSVTLNRLQRMTEYRFRLKSADADGNQAETLEFNFKTLADGGSVVALPRFDLGQAQQSGASMASEDLDVITGMALANLGWAADLKFTAVDISGNLITGTDIFNPQTRQMGPLAQLALLDWQVFGDGFIDSDAKGWIKMESTSADVAGFFLTFDSGLSFMDGTNFGDAGMKDFAFTEIEPSGSTQISIANPGSAEATVTLNLMAADGSVRGTQTRTVPANGALVADLHRDLFDGITPDPSDYVLMKSTEGVESFEMMKKSSGDMSYLTGQDLSAGATVLYSPQYVVGGPWKTTLSVVNLDAREGMASFRFVNEEGVQIGTMRAVSIPAYGKVFIDDPEFFTSNIDLSEANGGYIEIVSDGIRLTGSTVFGDSRGYTFSSALPLVCNYSEKVVFSHVASNSEYFTGLAILNPNAVDAEVTIELHNASGGIMDSITQTIPARQRSSKVLTQYFPSIVGQNPAGYIKVIAPRPIVTFALFGTNNLTVLSAIPPQDAR